MRNASVTTTTEAYSISASSAAAAGTTSVEEPGGRRGRRGEDDGVRLDPLRGGRRTGHDREAGLGAGQLAHRHTGPHRAPSPPGSRSASPARRAGRRRPARRWTGSSASEQRPVRPRGRPAAARWRAPRAAGPGRRTPRRAAAPRAGRPPRRRAGSRPGRRPRGRRRRGVPGCSASTRASPSSERTPDSRSSRQVHRHTHHRAGQRPQGAAGPDARRLDRGVHDVQPELVGQRDAFRAAVEHRLRPDVDHHSADLGPPELAARLGRRLEHGDLVAVLAQDVGRGQPGEPAAHDQYPHGSSLADLVPPRPGAGRGGTRSLRRARTAVRTRCGGRPVARTCRCARPHGAAAGRSCGPRPRPRGRPCSRSGPAPRPA